QALPAGLGVWLCRKTAWTITTGPPATRGVFKPGVEHVASSGEAQCDGVGRAPFVECASVEKAHQDVNRPAGASQRAGSGQGVIECLNRQLLGIVRRLGGRADKAAQLA